MGIIFMAGLTHSNDTTGKDKKRYGFRHFFNAYMSGVALAPVLGEDYGTDRKAYHLTADYTWGWTQEESIKNATEALGWKTVTAVRTPLGAGDFSQYLTPVLNSGADVLILNHYGKDMVNSLTQAVQFGMRDKQVNGKQLRDRRAAVLRADGPGRRRRDQGHLRHRQLGLEARRTTATKAFTKSFGAGVRPAAVAGGAHLLRPGAALRRRRARRAGTFYPPEVDQGARGLRVRRHGQRPDALPRRRPPVLQGGARGAGQGGRRPTSSTCSRW